MNSNMQVQFFTDSDTGETIAELYTQDKQWASISETEGELIIEIFNCPRERKWALKLPELIQILEQAQLRLK